MTPTAAIQQAGLTEAFAAFEAGEGFVVDNVAFHRLADDLKVLLDNFNLQPMLTLLVAPIRRRATSMLPRWSMTEAVLSHLMNILIVTGHASTE